MSASQQDDIIEADDQFLLPSMIDDQVHFRELGLTHKGTIASESRAAVAGGITNFMEMPNVSPATTSIEALEKKFVIASQNAVANHSFYLGATEDNLDQIKLLDSKKHCSVKIFMDASTGDLLVKHPQALETIFRESSALIVTHCESSPIIDHNLDKIRRSGHIRTIFDHPTIRDTEACYPSSSYAVNLSKKYQSQLHVLHITTKKELSLFEFGPIENKHITAEACVHHLWFSEEDYKQQGNFIKCNSSIKSAQNRDALIQALHNNQIEIISTDHAPHTLEEKQQDYQDAPAGLALVEHALLSLLDHVKQGRLNLEQIVEKTAHNPTKRYAVENRGYIRKGYYADLVLLVDMKRMTPVSNDNTLYHCGWTPFNDHQFSSSIQSTWVNGQQVFNRQHVLEQPLSSKRLTFNR